MGGSRVDKLRKLICRKPQPLQPPTRNMITVEQLATLTSPEKAHTWITSLNETTQRFNIHTPLRQAHFLAQILHETGNLRWLTELWGPTAAQERYEGRMDLGNTQPGDGYKYRGRGAIQLTGRYNYTLYTRYTGIDFLANPSAVAEPPHAILVAGWYWMNRGINAEADLDDLHAVTRKVNGGLNGIEDRAARLQAAREVLYIQ